MLVLPESCGTREMAENLVKNLTDPSPIVSLTKTLNVAQGFVDEFCKTLISKGVDQVTFINAPERFQNHFMRSHMLRSAKFFVTFR